MNNPKDLDSLYTVTDDMQDAIDKMEADPWTLRPNKNGDCPKDLIADPSPEQIEEGYAEKWGQNELAEIVRTSVAEFQNDDGSATHKVQITFKAIDPKSPNNGKQIDFNVYLEPGNEENNTRSLGRLYNTIIKPLGLKWLQGSPLKTVESLKGRRANIRVFQSWQHPWDFDRRVADKTKPKKFAKKIVEVKKP